MKKLILLPFLFLAYLSFGQIDEIAEIEGYSYEVRVLLIDHDMPKILVYEPSENHFDLYNEDYTLYRSVDIPYNYQGSGQYNMFHVSRTLFDCDTTNIEYLISWSGQTQVWTKVIREDETELLSEEDVVYNAFNTATPESNGIVSGSNGSLLHLEGSVWGAPLSRIYHLCGQLPRNTSRMDSTMTGLTEEDEILDQVKLYPNPSDSQITIDYDLEGNESGTIKVFSMKGQLVEEKQLGSFFNKVMLDISDYSAGSYIVKIQTASGEILSERFIKVEK
ncbi:T9SS type A sorting domain-containing protein [Halocola ammonii]